MQVRRLLDCLAAWVLRFSMGGILPDTESRPWYLLCRLKSGQDVETHLHFKHQEVRMNEGFVSIIEHLRFLVWNLTIKLMLLGPALRIAILSSNMRAYEAYDLPYRAIYWKAKRRDGVARRIFWKHVVHEIKRVYNVFHATVQNFNAFLPLPHGKGRTNLGALTSSARLMVLAC